MSSPRGIARTSRKDSVIEAVHSALGVLMGSLVGVTRRWRTVRHRPARLAVVVPALTAAAMGCGASERERVDAAVTTVNGEERWSYDAAPANRLPWTFDTLAVIGEAFAGSDVYQFDQVARSGLAGDDAGELYLLDAAGKRVLRFGSDGEHRATYGHAGSGPADLGQPLALALGAGDSVWVSDIGNRRITVYPTSGVDPRSLDYAMNRRMPPDEIRIVGDEYFHVLQPFGMLRGSVSGTGPDATRPVLARFQADGVVRDTIWRFPQPRRDVTEVTAPGAAGRAIVRTQTAFEPERRWDVLPDGTAVISDSAAYSIALVASDGTLIRRIERDPPPRETTDADREAERQRRAETMIAGDGAGGGHTRAGLGSGAGGRPPRPPSAVIESMLENMRFEPVIPRITGLTVDTSDRIWVGVSVDAPNAVERIDVYAADGTLLGELHDVPLPDRFFGPGLAAKLVRDELDVQRVLVLRLNDD